MCKSYVLGNSRFKNSCAYKHNKRTFNKDHKLLSDKVEVLEKVVNARTRKVLSLEEKAEKRRKKDIIKVIKEPKKPQALKVKDNENINEVSEENGSDNNQKNQKKNKNMKDSKSQCWMSFNI